MCIDLALISYFHCLRITSWIGDFAHLIENEFFGVEGLKVNYKLWDHTTHPAFARVRKLASSRPHFIIRLLELTRWAGLPPAQGAEVSAPRGDLSGPECRGRFYPGRAPPKQSQDLVTREARSSRR